MERLGTLREGLERWRRRAPCGFRPHFGSLEIASQELSKWEQRRGLRKAGAGEHCGPSVQEVKVWRWERRKWGRTDLFQDGRMGQVGNPISG